MSETDAEQDKHDQILNGMIDSAPTIAAYHPDDIVAQNLISDLATGLNKNPVVAARYGLSIEQLYGFVANPEVRRRIKAKRAIWESNDNLAERNRAYWGNVTLEAAPVADKMIHDPNTPAAVRAKLMEISGRFSGVEAKPRADEFGGLAAQFSVTIQFSSAGKVETINLPKTIDADPEDASS